MLHELPFAKIIKLSDTIAEVIINDGVEMDAGMVEQYHEFLLSLFSGSFSLLINKVNSYTYSFDAQVNLATLTEINAIAVVTYSRAAKVTTDYLATNIPREVEWNMKGFSNRDEALTWLKSQREI